MTTAPPGARTSPPTSARARASVAARAAIVAIARMCVFMSGFPTLLPRQVLLVERQVLVRQSDIASCDDDTRHLGPDFERVAVCHEQVGVLALFDAAGPVGDSEDPGGVDRQRLERVVAVQPPGDRYRRVVRERPHVVVCAGG